MIDPVQALLAQTSLQNNLFTSSSRYYGLPVETLDLPDGTTITYVTRRFVPAPERFQTLQHHTVTQGERLDNIAAKYLGDPRLFWRLCDANRAMRPEDLTDSPGRALRITLPAGITGSSI
jgi:hypothetical protein